MFGDHRTEGDTETTRPRVANSRILYEAGKCFTCIDQGKFVARVNNFHYQPHFRS